MSYSSAQLLFFAATKVETKLVTKEEKILLGRLVKVYSPRALASALTLALMLQRNTMVSIAPFTPNVIISVNTSIKIQMGSGPIQNCKW